MTIIKANNSASEELSRYKYFVFV